MGRMEMKITTIGANRGNICSRELQSQFLQKLISGNYSHDWIAEFCNYLKLSYVLQNSSILIAELSRRKPTNVRVM